MTGMITLTIGPDGYFNEPEGSEEVILNRKWFSSAFATSLLTAAVLSGCTAEPASPGGSGSGAAPEAPDNASNLTPAGTFPIVNEKVTLKVLVNGVTTVEDYRTNEFTKWLEETTNVRIEWDIAPASGAAEKLNLVLASGDYPDMIMNFAISPTQQLIYGQQGVFIPLNELIEKQGIETQKMLAKYPDIHKAISAPDGKIYALPRIDENYHNLMNQKMWIYQPWLDKLGLQMPTTTEEFYEVLKAFKTRDPNGNGKADEIPLGGSKEAVHQPIRFLMNSFILNNDMGSPKLIFAEDGSIDTAFNKPAWKEGLAYLHKLYSEGLIAPDVFTQDAKQLKQLAEFQEPILGATSSAIIQAFTDISDKTTRWKEYKTVPPLKGPGGVQITPYNPYPFTRGITVITSGSKHPEIAMRWADAMYSEEFTKRSYQGTPGVGWGPADAGEPGLNGEPAKWKRLLSFGVMQNLHWYQSTNTMQDRDMWGSMAVDRSKDGAWINWEETSKNYEPYRVANDVMVPPIFYTEDQANELADIEKTINDYVDQMTTKFITGNTNISQQWDNYVNTLENMGLKKMLQIYNDAYRAQYKKN